MFEKHRSSKQDPGHKQAGQDNFTASANPPPDSGRVAVIGPGIQIKGDITGNEDLIIEGKVTGKIKLDSHVVDIGKNAQVNADITAQVIQIAGSVRGDLNGTEKVVISSSGNVHGNIVAPRMTLEDGAIFKGSIDMDPGEPAKPAVAKPVAREVAGNAAGKTADTAKVVAGKKAKENAGYTLGG